MAAPVVSSLYVLYGLPLEQETNIWLLPGQPASAVQAQLPTPWQSSATKLILKTAFRFKPLRAGYYQLRTGTTVAEMARRLFEGESNQVRVTLPEGLNMFEVSERLEKAGIVSADQFLAACRDKVLLKKLTELDIDRCEGFLFPETYQFMPFQSPGGVLKTFIESYRNQTSQLFETYSLPDPHSQYRVLILASIIEKETGILSEQPLIASVFLNRLFRNMRLQSDPTTIYGIWESFDGNLRRSDIEKKTAYNTYRKAGLTPTPIANPGLSAIKAALKPAASSYLYFVADGTGGHKFSTTYRAHTNAVNRFQKRRRK